MSYQNLCGNCLKPALARHELCGACAMQALREGAAQAAREAAEAVCKHPLSHHSYCQGSDGKNVQRSCMKCGAYQQLGDGGARVSGPWMERPW